MLCVGDILGNLRVRISDLWKKSSPKKIFKILFQLETFKNDHSRQETEVTSVLVFKPMCPFTYQNALLFPKLPFHFPKLSFNIPVGPSVSWNKGDYV